MYHLSLTEADFEAICFVGYRYGWSNVLYKHGVGEHDIPEHEAWAIKEACDSDTEGGHCYFPMLDMRSELASKLFKFLDSIV
jgi:hypothetical protein